MHKKFKFSATRVSSLTDNVIAVAMTLLIFGIGLPTIDALRTDSGLLHALSDIVPLVYAYIISFFLISKYWELHHFVFAVVKEVPGDLLWRNFLFLLFITFIPFPATLMSKFDNRVSIILFDICIDLPAIALIICAQLIMHMEEKFLYSSSPADMQVIRSFCIGILVIPAVSLASIALSFWRVDVAGAVWIITPFLITTGGKISIKRKKRRNNGAAP